MIGLRDGFTKQRTIAIVLILSATFGLTTAVEAQPVAGADFGDAPEGALAYPSTGVIGQFPTCVGVGPAAWIEHASQGQLYLGPKVDLEFDGNAGQCPAFNPNNYDRDETIKDGDAGLLKPRAYSIRGPVGSEEVYSLTYSVALLTLGNANWSSYWGVEIDLEVTNKKADGKEAYLNVLMDWNQDGKWQGAALGPAGLVPEHVLVNFPIPHGFSGPISELNPPPLLLGPNPGYVWSRFTLTERKVPENWQGDGIFADGETEDYLLLVDEPVFFCEWNVGDPNKMHWPQLGDTRSTGMAVDMFEKRLAEDFQCIQSGPITGIHFWGGFLDDTLPALGVDRLGFKVSIYSNLPPDEEFEWSRPGELLWSRDVPRYSYDVYQVTGVYDQGWFDPASKFYEPANHRRSLKYSICFRDDDEELFTQRRGEIYWVEIKEIREESAPHVFGWKPAERRLQFAGNAVWHHPSLGWLPLSYPDGHPHQGLPLDLSLVVTGRAIPEVDTDFGSAPDPPYPTLLASNGARHIIVPGIHLGRGFEDDGVEFISPLTPGDVAVVEVTASTTGALNAWIDFNGDGDWDDPGEHIFRDETLMSGLNTLVFSVPADAVSGMTWSRWRFSTVRGLGTTGVAADGEVEDYAVPIEEIGVPGKPASPHLKWSQPPIERTPGSSVPEYCGWDEPSYTNKPQPTSVSSWQMVADDFRSPGGMPITSVRWWGSYQGWDKAEVPSIRPQSWRIGFWRNTPAGGLYPFSRPGELLWVVNVQADRVVEQWVGIDTFPRAPSDTCFEYVLKLDPQEYFRPSDFTAEKDDETIFWVSITAVYTGSPGPSHAWGWKTRPQSWMDAAVKFDIRRDDLRPGIAPDPATIQPLANSDVCEPLEAYDMAFELDTDPAYIKWAQPFTGLRQWPHYEDELSLAVGVESDRPKWTQGPDLTRTGMDVDITRDLPPTWPTQLAADDFECTTTGPVTRIALWGSWYRDIPAGGSAENVTFTLSIRENVPAHQSSTGYSMPGKVVWRKEFSSGDFTIESQEGQTQSYYSPGNDVFDLENHKTIYKYTFDIDPKDAFQQTGSEKDPVVYWLCAQASLIHPPGSVATRFGWKSSSNRWNNTAVWAQAREPFEGTWQRLTYPKGHSLSSQPVGLAFEIETPGAAGTGDVAYQRLVADDWECSSPASVTGLAWWGSYIGYGYQACECQPMSPPRSPDYFLLSIWSDASGQTGFGRPGEKLWEYKAEEFDEVMVGFDKHPEPHDSSIEGFEPVYRYTVQLPEENVFTQTNAHDVYWLSVVAVYEDAKTMTYPWGWTNHPSEPWDISGQNLIAHWKLDESSGTVASDSSGNGNHGTVIGRPDWRPHSGQIGGALDLDGRNDYIVVSKPEGFNFAPGSFSASAWVKPTEVGGRWQAIMEYDRDSFNGNRFGLWINANGRFHFRVGRNTWQTTQTLKANTWHLLTATYDGDTGRMRLYIDGMLDAAATHVAGFAFPVESTLTLGVRGSQDDEFFNGLLDDVRVYDARLSDEEVLRLIGVGRNSNAVAATPKATGAAGGWDWVELYDQTGAGEDMSFVLFTEPKSSVSADDDDDDDDVFYIEGPWPTVEATATDPSQEKDDSKK